jgi:hypothetical protein
MLRTLHEGCRFPDAGWIVELYSVPGDPGKKVRVRHAFPRGSRRLPADWAPPFSGTTAINIGQRFANLGVR